MAAEPAAEPAAEGSASTSAGFSLGSDDGASADAEADANADGNGGKKAKDRGDKKWIHRWAPERNMGEVGIFGGVLFPARRLELFEPDTSLPLQGFKEFNTVAPDVGLRGGYYPLRFFGVEGEAAVMPTQTADSQSATLWGLRANLVGQLGLWSVTPFVLVGASMLNVNSERAAVGNDIDAAVHFGGGVKFYLTRYTQLRLDIRDNVTAGQGVDDGVIHSPEILLGFSVTLGRSKVEGPKDTDGDGLYDYEDECVEVPGPRVNQGCPIPDSDGDGLLDPDDKCPNTPGVPEYEGCPIPDSDGDGILDPDDKCPDTPGVPEYEGCPIPDTDGDGILDPDDQCVKEPETPNGFKDADGCPDEIPKEVAQFTGVIKGIYFDTNKDTIKPKSEKVLQQALDVLKKFPDLKVQISGHTDSRGKRDHNLDLSRRRAEAVKKWLSDHGIANSRMTSRGVGPDEPIESNDTKSGRAKNRRIEFKLQ
ncbi:MAG: OmpA family protein [Myxococcota bacterium]